MRNNTPTTQNLAEKPSPNIPDDLFNEIVENRCVLFIGDQFSHESGFPDWDLLISMMIMYCKNNNIRLSKENEASIEIMKNKKEFDLIAEFLREILGENLFQNFMKITYGDKQIKKIPKIYEIIKAIPFTQILTTSYDKLLEKIYELSHIKTILNLNEINELTRKNKFFILKIHGSIEKVDSIVLGKSNYGELIYNNPVFIDILNLLFRTKTFLFCGYSLDDPYLLTLLEKLKKTLKIGPLHYMLVNEKEYFDLKKIFFKKYYNIILISYHTVNDHIVLYRLFNNLYENIKNLKYSSKSKEKIFLSGSSQVKNIMDTLYKELKKLNYIPIWYKRKFPIDSINSIQECFRNVENSDRIVLVIGESYGTKIKPNNLSITEEEFNHSYYNEIPILVFIQSNIFYQIDIYEKQLKIHNNFLSIEMFEDLGLAAEQDVFDFILRIKKKRFEGEEKIPWITHFEYVDEIIKTISEKGKYIEITKKDLRKKIKIPYKFLNYFDIEDKEIFFGRDDDINNFMHQIESSKLTLLFGKSGVGKTSFILAGLFPKLQEKKYYPIYVRSIGDPLKTIKDRIIFEMENYFQISNNAKHSKKRFLEIKNQSENLDFPNVIIIFNELIKKPLVIIIDQFEEFFINLSQDTKRKFINVLKEAYYRPLINFKLILSFREDFFVEFNEIGEEIPDIFNHRFRLRELSKNNAKEAIIKPLEIIGLKLEKDLLENILNDLTLNNIVEPPQLQIVCFILYTKLKENEKEIKIKDYIKLGGVKGILMDYVDYALEPFNYEHREIAKEIMKSMVSAKKTKIPLKETEINNIKLNGKIVNNYVLNYIIKELINRRLVIRKVIENYEVFALTHEYLINKIKKWIDKEDFKLKEAQDLLRQEENNWKYHKGIMEKYKFEFINDFKDKLILDDIKKGLLLRTSVEYNINIDYWIETNINNNNAISFIEHALNNPDNEIKRNAIKVILQFDVEDEEKLKIIELLKEIGNPNVVNYFLSKGKEVDTTLIKKIKEAVEYRFTKNMAFIEAGNFIMGRDEEEIRDIINKGAHKSWFIGEYPKRKVYVKSFLIDKFLVTNNEYKEFNPNHTFPKDHEKKPATNINYFQAKKYAEWLDKVLPIEEEWEKAARGIDGRLFPWGNEWDPNKCNTRLSGITGKTEIDKYPNGISPYGCFDMAGNIWEWTKSWKEKDRSKIVKGGSWSKFDILPWCSYRFNYEINEGQQNLGFRCIRRVSNIKGSNKVYSAGGLIFKIEKGIIKVILCGNDDPPEWRIPKGMLEKNEEVRDCTIREVLEETGHLTKIIEFIAFSTWSYFYDNKLWDEMAFFYLLELVEENEREHDSEFTNVKWFEINKALKILTFNNEKEILKKGYELFKKYNL